MSKNITTVGIAIAAMLFVSFIAALIVNSCEDANEDNELKKEIVEKSNYLEVKPLQYKGHDYLWFRTKMRKGFGGITHDPDCKCNKE